MMTLGVQRGITLKKKTYGLVQAVKQNVRIVLS